MSNVNRIVTRRLAREDAILKHRKRSPNRTLHLHVAEDGTRTYRRPNGSIVDLPYVCAVRRKPYVPREAR